MKYSCFTKEVRERLQNVLGAGYHVSIQKLRRNNGIKTDAAVISVSGSSITECMAVSSYYKLCRKKADLDIIVEELVRDYMIRKSKGQIPDISTVYNWNESGENVVFRLVNTDANKELLHEIPHFGFLDLSQVFYLLLDWKAEGGHSILITNMLMAKWGISAVELQDQAQKNTPIRMPENMTGIHSLLSKETAGTAGDLAGIKTYMLTNRLNLYGAGCILYEGVLEKAAGMCGSGFYVLPCSVHELILIPAEKYCQDFVGNLKQIVMSINHELVPEQDILSDSIYYHDKEEKYLKIVM